MGLVEWLILGAIAVLGLVTGSFLTTLVSRVPTRETSVSLKSKCPKCDSEIGVRDQIPVVGWLLLRTRCRDCRMSIPIRYPLIEAGTAFLFVVVGLRFGLSWELPAFLYLAAISVVLGLIDLDTRRLPNVVVLPSYLVGGFLFLIPSIAEGDWSKYLAAWLGALGLFMVYFAMAWVYPAGMGFGDVKLAGLLGLYLGWLGWGVLMAGTFFGFLSGALVGVGLMVFGSAGRKTRIPFGPFMLIGAWIAILWGETIADWYAGIALSA